MESIRNTSEHVEQVEGEAVGSRNAAVRHLRKRRGLGPPDLVAVSKTLGGKTADQLGDSANLGFYHWVLGQDVSSAASMAAYFAELRESVEKRGFYQSLWSSEDYAVSSGTYCCYDAFSRTDLRCMLAIPGGVAVEAVDGTNVSASLTQEIWIGAAVSAFLRTEILDLQTLSDLGALRRIEAVPTPEAEQQLLRAVEQVYADERLRSRVPQLHEDPGRGVRAEDWDILCIVLYHHFQRRQRLEQACDFFSGLVESYTEAAMYASLAEYDLDLFDEALMTLEGAVKKAPNSAVLKVALGQRLLEVGKIQRAVTLAQEALEIEPTARCAWLLLAHSYSAGEAYNLSLVATNLTPMPPEFPDAATILGALPPPPFHTTTPTAMMHDPEVEEMKKQEEEATTDGNDELLGLTAAVLLPLEPMEGGHHLNISQHRAATCVHGAVYSVLSRIVDAVGWDEFLEERRNVFLMSDEVGSSSSSGGSGSDGESSSEPGGSDSSGPDDIDILRPVHPPPRFSAAAGPLSAISEEAGAAATTVGERTPPPSDYRPPAAPPPSGQPMEIIDASSVSLEEHKGSPKASSVNPLLWSSVYGGGSSAAGGGGAEALSSGLQNMALGEQPPGASAPRRGAHDDDDTASSPPSSSSEDGESSGDELYDRDEDPAMLQGDSGALLNLRDLYESRAQELQEALQGGAVGRPGEEEEEEADDQEEEEDEALQQEADRQWMIEGNVAAILGQKRLSTGWVDEVVHALYKDLSEYMSWILLDRRLRRAGKRHLEVRDEEEEEGDDDGSGVDEDEAIDDIVVPVFQAVDWMRRGLMCIRLGKVEDAERALRIAVNEGFNMTAYQALSRIYAVKGLTPDAMNAVVEILAHHEETRKDREYTQMPQSVLWTFCTAVMVSGLQEAREALKGAPRKSRVPEPTLHRLLDDAVLWQTDGFDA